CWPLRLLFMDSPQYFLSPVFSGVPVSSKYAFAHTRPSVVSLQFAGGLEALTSMHFFLTSRRIALCWSSHRVIPSSEVSDTSPDPESSIIFTIGLGGSAFLQPTNITTKTKTRIETAIHVRFMWS